MVMIYPHIERVNVGITKADLAALARQRAELYVSIFMPCSYGGWQKPQYGLSLTNILTQTARHIPEMHTADGVRILDKLWHFSHAHQAPGYCAGLALFATPTFLRVFALPIEMDEQIIVGDHFCIQPVLPILNDNGEFDTTTPGDAEYADWAASDALRGRLFLGRRLDSNTICCVLIHNTKEWTYHV